MVKTPIYLDSHATTPVDPKVFEEISGLDAEQAHSSIRIGCSRFNRFNNDNEIHSAVDKICTYVTKLLKLGSGNVL